MDDKAVFWNRPVCDAKNVDYPDETATPMCEDCFQTFLWAEIAPAR